MSLKNVTGLNLALRVRYLRGCSWRIARVGYRLRKHGIRIAQGLSGMARSLPTTRRCDDAPVVTGCIGGLTAGVRCKDRRTDAGLSHLLVLPAFDFSSDPQALQFRTPGRIRRGIDCGGR
jgi:hypothetical protein